MIKKGTLCTKIPAAIDAIADLTELHRAGKVTIYKDTGEGTPMECSPTLPWISAMQNQAANFVKAIKGEKKPPCEAAEAMEDLKVAREYLRLLLGK